MTTIAVIQSLYPVLNDDPASLSGFSKQVYEKFFEVLVEESGYTVHTAKTLEEYQEKEYPPAPDVVVCAPFAEIGNPAPGFVELTRFKNTFPNANLIVWSNRTEGAIRKSAIEEYGAKEFYTGNLLQAADDFADMIFSYRG